MWVKLTPEVGHHLDTSSNTQTDRGRMPSCCITETNLSTVLAVAKLAGSHHRRMKRRQKTHPPFYINSTGGRQKSITTSEDELTPQHSMTGSTNKQTNDFLYFSLSQILGLFTHPIDLWGDQI